MKKNLWFLRLVIILLGLTACALTAALVYAIIEDMGKSSRAMAIVLVGILSIVCTSAAPFWLCLRNGLRLLGLIESGQAFSAQTVQAFAAIKLSAALMSALYMLGLPLFYILGEVDDAPGVIVIGLMMIVAPLTVAAFAGVMQRLFAEASGPREETELTV